MSAGEMAMTNARLVLPDRVITGGIAVRGASVAAIDEGPSRVGEDLEADYLIPGLIELHTDHLESHYAPRPGVCWNPMAALQAHDAQIATSGITTVFDALRAGMDIDEKGLGGNMGVLAEAIRTGHAEGRLRAEHFVHLRCEVSAEDVVDSLTAFVGNPHLRLVSVMDHTPGQRQFVRLDKYKQYYQGKTGMSDADLERFMAERTAAHHTYARAHRREIVDICRQVGIPLASHDDATEDHVREAVQDGAAICEFPTTLQAARTARASGLDVLMGAPNVVRGGSHSGNVSACELAGRGWLDILSSDYVPFSLLHAAFSLPQRVPGLSLPESLALVTRNPAAAVGLGDRGQIAVEKRADLVRVGFDGDVPVVKAVWRAGRRVA
ncbi:MAG: alpha-D-ribose 1-methylphosphonate 5-triphosphate diphosphatase [Hyphomicrobiales bacterium]|nr:alpha-D-ribose 1-methylphosphonate 5-triphosphate diphosphatase [Hyphomicrobiales bacterium]